MPNQDDGRVRGIIANPEIISKPLVDASGQVWIMEEFKNQPENSYLNGMLFTKKVAGPVDAVVAKQVSDAAAPIIKSYINNEFREVLTAAIKSAEPMISKCLKDGGDLFKKLFVERLSAYGTQTFNQIINELSDDIKKASASTSKEPDDGMSCTGIIPPGARLKWSAKRGMHEVVLFLMEEPPQVRTVHIGGKFRRLAFPWIRLLVMFVDGAYAYLFVFYGKESVKSQQAKLYYPGLPHFWNRWPYDYCVGYNLPTIRISSEWWSTIIDNYFWEKSFVVGTNHPIYDHWAAAKERIPEMATLDDWEKFSLTSPEKMSGLPWSEFEHTADGFARKVIEWYIDGNFPAKVNNKNDAAVIKDKVIEKFGERIKEEIYFLAQRFVVNDDLKNETVGFTDKQIEACRTKFIDSLSLRSNVIAREIVERCMNMR